MKIETITDACEVASTTKVEEWPVEIFINFVPGITIFGLPLSIDDGASLTNTLITVGLCSSKGDVRRMMKQNAIRVRGVVVTEERPITKADTIHDIYVVLSSGKSEKKIAVIK
jgi:tyrosyl-tRNA synthetase